MVQRLPPSMTQVRRNYSVNRPGWETIKQSLYDFQVYAAAGQTVLNFFTTPAGSGGKTLSDTNMTLAGQLPANQEFLIQSIEVVFFPTVPAVAADNPSAFGAQDDADIINDVYQVLRTGNLQLTIGSKPYLQEAPIGRFPPKTHMEINAAASDGGANAVATQQLRIAYAYAAGRPYLLSPADLELIQNQNFTVALNWPEGVQALPSGNPARIGVVLDGYLYRRPQ